MNCNYKGTRNSDKQKHGKGKEFITYTDEDQVEVYDGDWECDQKHGHGIISWHSLNTEGVMSRTVMEGHFVHGYMTEGKCEWPNGESYCGELCNYLLHGTGKKTFKDGSTFQGTFCKNEMEKGKRIYHDGSSYKGKFENDMKHGKGTYRCKDGTKYKGEWEKDLKHGYGTRTCTDGKIEYKGTWKDDKYHGHGILNNSLYFFDEGNIYVASKENLYVLLLGSCTLTQMNQRKEKKLNSMTCCISANEEAHSNGKIRDLKNCEDFFNGKSASMTCLYGSNVGISEAKKKITKFLNQKQQKDSDYCQYMIIYSGEGSKPFNLENNDGGNWEYVGGNICYHWLEKRWKNSKAYKSCKTSRLIIVADSSFSGFWIEKWKTQKNPVFKLRMVIQTATEKLEILEGASFLHSWIAKQKKRKLQEKTQHTPKSVPQC